MTHIFATREGKQKRFKRRDDGVDLTPPEPFSALIFDCDGTLADTPRLHFAAWRAALAPVGVELPESWYLARVGLSRLELLRQVQRDYACELEVAEVSAAQARHFCVGLHTVQAVDVVADVARRHVGTVPMAVASGGEREIVEATLETTGLRHLFNTVVTINDVRRGKPAPDLVLEAALRLGVEPESCVVYEDSDEGLEAGRRAGMTVMDVRRAVAASLR